MTDNIKQLLPLAVLPLAPFALIGCGENPPEVAAASLMAAKRSAEPAPTAQASFELLQMGGWAEFVDQSHHVGWRGSSGAVSVAISPPLQLASDPSPYQLVSGSWHTLLNGGELVQSLQVTPSNGDAPISFTNDLGVHIELAPREGLFCFNVRSENDMRIVGQEFLR